MENGNFSQSGKRQAQRIDFLQEEGVIVAGGGLDRLIQVENAQKFIVQKKFFRFSLCFPSNEGKGKKNFHLPDGCCFLLLRRAEERAGERWGPVCSWAWQ